MCFIFFQLSLLILKTYDYESIQCMHKNLYIDFHLDIFYIINLQDKPYLQNEMPKGPVNFFFSPPNSHDYQLCLINRLIKLTNAPDSTDF